MNWGRAKTILIVSFLCLNMVLGYQLWSNRWSQSAANADTADMIDETNKLLAAKKIKVLPEIPKDTPKLATIRVRYPEAFRLPKQVRFDKPMKLVSLLNRDSVRGIEEETPIDHFDSYRLDPVSGSSNGYTFHQMEKDLPMFDVSLQFFAANDEITGYKQSYVEVQSGVESDDKSAQKIISAYAAIRSLAENYLKEGAVITDIRLGYHGQLYDSVDQTFVPNWRVTLSEGEPYYVHAFTGAVEGAEAIDQPIGSK